MKNRLKKTLGTMLVIVLMLMMTNSTFIQAEDIKPYMETLNVKWDLKPNKKIKFQTAVEGIGYKNCTAIIKNYKITDAKGKEGYKKLTFSIVENKPKKYSNKEIYKIVKVTQGDNYH